MAFYGKEYQDGKAFVTLFFKFGGDDITIDKFLNIFEKKFKEAIKKEEMLEEYGYYEIITKSSSKIELVIPAAYHSEISELLDDAAQNLSSIHVLRVIIFTDIDEDGTAGYTLAEVKEGKEFETELGYASRFYNIEERDEAIQNILDPFIIKWLQLETVK